MEWEEGDGNPRKETDLILMKGSTQSITFMWLGVPHVTVGIWHFSLWYLGSDHQPSVLSLFFHLANTITTPTTLILIYFNFNIMQQRGFYVAEKGQCTQNENNTKYKTVKKIILVGVAISIVGLSYCKKVIWLKEMKLTPKLIDSVAESKLLALLTARQASESKRGGVEVRKMTLLRKSADWEDGRLTPQNNHLIGVWVPCPFIDQRERSNVKLKSKGKTAGEAVGK